MVEISFSEGRTKFNCPINYIFSLNPASHLLFIDYIVLLVTYNRNGN